MTTLPSPCLLTPIATQQPICIREIHYAIPTDTLRGLEDAHLLPLIPQRTHTNRCARLALDVLGLEELVLLTKSEEVREEGVEVAFGAEVENLGVV